MVVFSLDLETVILILVVLLAVGAFAVVRTMLRPKDKSSDQEVDVAVVTDAPKPYRTGKFKLVPHGVREYVLYAEFEKWTGDIHNTYAERSYQPAGEEDVAAYYQKMSHELL